MTLEEHNAKITDLNLQMAALTLKLNAAITERRDLVLQRRPKKVDCTCHAHRSLSRPSLTLVPPVA